MSPTGLTATGCHPKFSQHLLSLGQVIQGEIEDRVERRASRERIPAQFHSRAGVGSLPGC